MRKQRLFENISTFSLLRDFGNHPFRIEYDKSKELFSIGLEEEKAAKAEKEKKGGIIVFAAELDAAETADDKIIDWVKKNFSALTDKTLNKNSSCAMTVGHYLNGRFKETFSEKSISVEIIGADENTLFSAAEDLCKEFDQECVLVKSYRSQETYLADLLPQ